MEHNNTKEITEMGGVITTTEAFIEKNKKVLTIAIVAVVVAILAGFGISKWNSNRSEKANTLMFAAEQYFAQGQYELALNGNTDHAGFLEVADKYGCTKAGRRAQYEAALCYLHLKQPQEALNTIKGYKGKDKLTPIFATIIEGCAQLEQGNNAAAIKKFESAIKDAKGYDDLTSYALFLNGMTYLMDGNNAKANEMFTAIKQYPATAEYRIIDEYIGLAEVAE